MKSLTVVIGVALWTCLIISTNAVEGDRQFARASPARIKSFSGKRYPPSPLGNETEDEETPGPPIPTGQARGPISPSSPMVNLGILGNLSSPPLTKRERRKCGG